jgi:hypothetical protein
MVLGWTQPLTETITRNLPGGRGQPACKADHLTAISMPMFRKCRGLDFSQLYGLPRTVTVIALFLIAILMWSECYMLTLPKTCKGLVNMSKATAVNELK